MYDEEDCGMSDVESDISSPEWEPWDDRDDSNDASQFENDAMSEIQQHEKEGIKSCGVNCQLIPVVSRHGTANTSSNRWKC